MKSAEFLIKPKQIPDTKKTKGYTKDLRERDRTGVTLKTFVLSHKNVKYVIHFYYYYKTSMLCLCWAAK